MDKTTFMAVNIDVSRKVGVKIDDFNFFLWIFR